MKKLILIIALLGLVTNANAYTNEDWRVYNGCKDKVYKSIDNGYDHEACSEMLSHKKALRKYGASSSYNYWIKRLGKKED